MGLIIMLLKDHAGAQPLWAQLYDILLERIMTEVYPLDELLPTDKDFMMEFGVSRITVRNAMDKLINEGFIMRQRGIGSKVIKNKEDEALLSTVLKSSYQGLVEDGNQKIVKSVEYIKPPIKVIDFFKLKENEKVIFLQREILKHDKIVGRHQTYLSPILPINEQSDFSGSLYEKFSSLGYEVSQVEEKITTHVISEEEKKAFEIEEVVSILRRERRVSFNQVPLEYTISSYLGTEYSLAINLT